MSAFLVVAAGVALAAVTYLGLERLGRRAVVPLVCRAVAWSALGLLLINLGCPARAEPGRPLVLLDGSLSMGAAGGRWAEARDSAARLGEVRIFGDAYAGADTVPTLGRSLLGPALTAAAASGRPVVVISDGEIEDGENLPADLLARAGVRLLARTPAPDLALTEVSGPARVASGDSIVVEAEIRALAGAAPESVRVTLEGARRRLATRVARLGPTRSARIRLRTGTGGLAPGEHVLQVSIEATDAEPRTDVRLHRVTVIPTPGVVLVAAPADWDSRFLYAALKDVAELPVRGYARLDVGRWRSLRDLRAVSEEQVRQAVRRADLLILKGAPPVPLDGTRARGIWRWPSGESEDAPAAPGDWYLQPGTPSPLDGAFAGAPLDSFAPAIQLVTRRAGDDEWVALTARNARRGPEWPAVTGRDGRVREVSVLADGLWRWAFRGGAGEQTYRAWVAATVSWLLAGADSAQGVARPVRPVVQQGLPLLFEWTAGGTPRATAVRWSDAPPDAPDTLRFDGAGRAAVRLPPGVYRYRLEPSGAGTVAVEAYSEELLPRAPVLAARAAPPAAARGERSSRDLPWFFLAAVLGLTGEWIARRRMGLR